jgi:hypothetical protein
MSRGCENGRQRGQTVFEGSAGVNSTQTPRLCLPVCSHPSHLLRTFEIFTLHQEPSTTTVQQQLPSHTLSQASTTISKPSSAFFQTSKTSSQDHTAQSRHQKSSTNRPPRPCNNKSILILLHNRRRQHQSLLGPLSRPSNPLRKTKLHSHLHQEPSTTTKQDQDPSQTLSQLSTIISKSCSSPPQTPEPFRTLKLHFHLFLQNPKLLQHGRAERQAS